MNAVQAAATFLPMVKALMLEAEATGASGTAKREAVAEAAERLYRQMQGSIKELRSVPWELVAPIVVPAADGLISVLAGMFNRLLGRVWTIFRTVETTA